MDRYGSIIKKLAGRHGAIFVDTQAAFDTILLHYHPMSLAWDRIHPNHIGHMILAKAFVNGIGFGW
jgi:lysophospholipase L1-like esterase